MNLLRRLWWRIRYGKITMGFDAADGFDTTVLIAYRRGVYRVLKVITRTQP